MMNQGLSPFCDVRGWVVTTDPQVAAWGAERGLTLRQLAKEELATGLALNPKEIRRFDRQSLLLLHVLHLAGVPGWPEPMRHQVPVQLAVGPAQTDLPALHRWGARVEPAEALPMVQPAQAIGLLPNTPLSHLSIACGLRGEASVWAGFADAGCRAVAAASLYLCDQSREQVLILAVSSPDNYFVRQVFERGFASPPEQMSEVAVALMLTHSSSEPCLSHIRQHLSSAAAATKGLPGVPAHSIQTSGGLRFSIPDCLTATPLLGLSALAAQAEPASLIISTPEGFEWQFDLGGAS